MSIEVLTESEGAPSAYPNPPIGLSGDAANTDPALVWERIEAWITRRWNVRTVEWIVEGAGSFEPRLKPATLTKAEQWDGTDWQVFEPTKGPLGLLFSGGMYRLTYDVGSADKPPAAVLEAYARLAEYWAEATDAGATSITDGDYSVTRSANAVARALQYSGAADLLRAYR